MKKQPYGFKSPQNAAQLSVIGLMVFLATDDKSLLVEYLWHVCPYLLATMPPDHRFSKCFQLRLHCPEKEELRLKTLYACC